MTRLTNSSYAKIVLVILLCLLICGTLTGACAAMRNAFEVWLSPWGEERHWVPQENDQVGSFTVDASSVQNISVDWLAGNLTIVVVPDDESNGLIEVTETSTSRIPLRWRNEGGMLEIDYGNIRSLMGCSLWAQNEKDVIISIPQSRAEALGEVALNAASGKYEISDIACDVLEVNQASGSVQVNGCIARELSCSMASGSFSYSGDVLGTFGFDQASGQAVVRLKTANPLSSTISMASGSMDLLLPSPDFQIELDKLSGNFNSDYELISNRKLYYGSAGALAQSLPSAQVNIDMMSGNLHLGKSN